MQNNFPERPNAENSVTPFGVLEMVIFEKTVSLQRKTYLN